MTAQAHHAPAHHAHDGRFVVFAELRSLPSAHFEAAIRALGTTYRLTTTVWLLNGTTTVGAVRNMLVPHLGSRDVMFIVELGTGRSAWHNFGSDVDARIYTLVDLPKAHDAA